MKRFVSTVFALAIIAFSAKAQGTDALPFTRIDLNPATAALAGAGSASNATAAYSAFSNASLSASSESAAKAGLRSTPSS